MDSANAIGNFPYLGNKILAPENLDDIPFNPPTSDLGSFLHAEIPKHNDPLKGVYENRHGTTQGASGSQNPNHHYLLLNRNLYRTISGDNGALKISQSKRLQLPDLNLRMSSASPERSNGTSFAELIIQVSRSLPGTPLGSPASSPQISRKNLTLVEKANENNKSVANQNPMRIRSESSSEGCKGEIKLEIPPSPPKTPTQESPKKPAVRRIKSEFTNRDLNIFAPTSM